MSYKTNSLNLGALEHALKGVNIPACPAVLVQIMDELNNPDASDRRIAALIGEVGDGERALASEVNAAWLAAAAGDEPWARYDLDRRATRRQCGHRVRFGADPLEAGRQVRGGDVVASGAHGRMTLSWRAALRLGAAGRRFSRPCHGVPAR